MNEGGRKQRRRVIIIKKRRSLRGRTRRPLTHAVDWEKQKINQELQGRNNMTTTAATRKEMDKSAKNRRINKNNP